MFTFVNLSNRGIPFNAFKAAMLQQLYLTAQNDFMPVFALNILRPLHGIAVGPWLIRVTSNFRYAARVRMPRLLILSRSGIFCHVAPNTTFYTPTRTAEDHSSNSSDSIPTLLKSSVEAVYRHDRDTRRPTARRCLYLQIPSITITLPEHPNPPLLAPPLPEASRQNPQSPRPHPLHPLRHRQSPLHPPIQHPRNLHSPLDPLPATPPSPSPLPPLLRPRPPRKHRHPDLPLRPAHPALPPSLPISQSTLRTHLRLQDLRPPVGLIGHLQMGEGPPGGAAQ
jgi:hypothetical protein